MNKPRKYNGVYKLPIKKHTRVRRPMSMYIIYTSGDNLCFDPAGSAFELVKDISIGLENPLKLTPEPALGFKHFECYIKIDLPKPSLLTRVKNWRKK